MTDTWTDFDPDEYLKKRKNEKALGRPVTDEVIHCPRCFGPMISTGRDVNGDPIYSQFCAPCIGRLARG